MKTGEIIEEITEGKTERTEEVKEDKEETDKIKMVIVEDRIEESKEHVVEEEIECLHKLNIFRL